MISSLSDQSFQSIIELSDKVHSDHSNSPSLCISRLQLSLLLIHCACRLCPVLKSFESRESAAMTTKAQNGFAPARRPPETFFLVQKAIMSNFSCLFASARMEIFYVPAMLKNRHRSSEFFMFPAANFKIKKKFFFC